MTIEEITQVLAVAAAVDSRAPQPHPDVLRVWQALLADVPVQAAERAVQEHYRRSRETITPADIVDAWKAQRARERDLEVARELRPVAPPEVGERGMLRAVGELAAAKALRAGRSADEAEDAREIAEGELGARRLWSRVRCPHCAAAPKSRCSRPGARGVRVERSTPHPSRVAAAMEVSVTESRPVSHLSE